MTLAGAIVTGVVAVLFGLAIVFWQDANNMKDPEE